MGQDRKYPTTAYYAVLPYADPAMGSSVLHRPAYRRLCKKLRQWRLDAGLTQTVLARQLRVPQSWVAKCELGERRVDPLEFRSWCRACGVDEGEAIRQL